MNLRVRPVLCPGCRDTLYLVTEVTPENWQGVPNSGPFDARSGDGDCPYCHRHLQFDGEAPNDDGLPQGRWRVVEP
jgi:hypothetical protein